MLLVTLPIWIMQHRLTRLVVLAINLGLALASLGLWVVAYTQGLSWRADFTAFYTAWVLANRGQGQHLYDYDLQANIQQRLLDGRHLAGGLLAFNYPPHAALLFSPLGKLTLDQAYLVWTAGQLGLLVCTSYVIWRHLSREGVSPTMRRLAVSAVLALPFVGATVLLGAFSILMLLGALEYAFALRRGDDLGAGLWVVLMTLKPQVAFVPALALVAARRWKAVGVLVCSGLVIFSVTSLGLGSLVWVSFWKALLTTFGADGSLGVDPSAMYNLRGLCTGVLDGRFADAGDTLGLVGFLISIVSTLCLWWDWEGGLPDFDLRMSATLLMAVFLSPHVNPQDGVLLVVPALLFWHYLRRVGRHSQLFGAIALACPALFWVTERFLSAPVLGLRAPVLALVVLGIWMLHELRLAIETRHAEDAVA